jgi:hypothetical protein
MWTKNQEHEKGWNDETTKIEVVSDESARLQPVLY